MIETRFAVGVEKKELHDLTYAQGCGVAALILVTAPLGGVLAFAVWGPLTPLGIAVGIFAPAIWLLGRAYFAPKQSIETLLKSDGVTVWGYNRRLPQPAQPFELFALPLDEVAACEAGRAMELFGTDFQLGAYKAVPYSMVGNQNALAQRKEIAQGSTAIFLRGKYGLTPVFAENIASALSFQLVGQISRFLDDARAIKAPPALTSATPAAPAADGFDL